MPSARADIGKEQLGTFLTIGGCCCCCCMLLLTRRRRRHAKVEVVPRHYPTMQGSYVDGTGPKTIVNPEVSIFYLEGYRPRGTARFGVGSRVAEQADPGLLLRNEEEEASGAVEALGAGASHPPARVDPVPTSSAAKARLEAATVLLAEAQAEATAAAQVEKRVSDASANAWAKVHLHRVRKHTAAQRAETEAEAEALEAREREKKAARQKAAQVKLDEAQERLRQSELELAACEADARAFQFIPPKHSLMLHGITPEERSSERPQSDWRKRAARGPLSLPDPAGGDAIVRTLHFPAIVHGDTSSCGALGPQNGPTLRLGEARPSSQAGPSLSPPGAKAEQAKWLSDQLTQIDLGATYAPESYHAVCAYVAAKEEQPPVSRWRLGAKRLRQETTSAVEKARQVVWSSERVKAQSSLVIVPSPSLSNASAELVEDFSLASPLSSVIGKEKKHDKDEVLCVARPGDDGTGADADALRFESDNVLFRI